MAKSMNNLNRKQIAPLSPKVQQMLSRGPVLDERLWTEITLATKGGRHGTSLVGDADQVSDALMKYYDLGVRHFLMQGFDFHRDPDLFGRGLIPMLRAKAAAREGAGAGAQSGVERRA
jgi:alkanesulfonate monooxygenase